MRSIKYLAFICIRAKGGVYGTGAVKILENMENAEKMDGDVLRFSTEVFSGSPT